MQRPDVTVQDFGVSVREIHMYCNNNAPDNPHPHPPSYDLTLYDAHGISASKD